jgi:hypothetical protein
LPKDQRKRIIKDLTKRDNINQTLVLNLIISYYKKEYINGINIEKISKKL